jgi:glutamate-1-semialdehyde 2,1-aminomutase
MKRSADLFQQAKRYLAGGVSRDAVLRDPHPLYADTADGCRIKDVDGVERIDFANNMATLIHGHAHPAIVEAVTRQLSRGTAYAMATEVEIEFARHLCGRCPAFDRVRFVNSGTEAVMTGVKAARASTGRARMAKVEGAYHGAYDYVEVSQEPDPDRWGDPRHPTPVALAHGTPAGVSSDVVVIPFNDPQAAREALDRHRGELACVLVDPMPHRAGLIPATSEYLETLRDWTRQDGSLLMLDEVITFRTEVGGMQARYDVKPDLTALGKIIGGGFPVGCLAGSREVMGVFSRSDGPPRLPHSGTFSANPITMIAGLTAMRLFGAEEVARLNRLGGLARERIAEAIGLADVPASVTGAGSAFRLHMKPEPPTDYRSAFPTPAEKRTGQRVLSGLLDSGILIAGTGAGFLSTPMREAEIDRLAEALLTSLRAAWATKTA